MDFINTIKYRFKNAGMVEKLIYINLAIFIVTFLLNTIGFLFKLNTHFLMDWFALPANFNSFLNKPWTILTYGFLHAGFLHILLNLIVLFYIGNLFIEYFTPKQLLTFYLLGTLFGGVIYLISYNLFPAFINDRDSILVGASAGISAILIGICTYIPNYQLKFPLIGYIKLWHIGAFWIAMDILGIPISNAGGHLAHLGGALFGFLYVNSASNKKLDTFTPKKKWFSKKKPTMKTVYKANTKKTNTTKNTNQQQIDAILDKISKSGYETLTKEEKEFLFKQGK